MQYIVIAVALYQMYTAQYSTALIQSFAALLVYAVHAVRTYTHSMRSEDTHTLSLLMEKEEQEVEDEDEKG